MTTAHLLDHLRRLAGENPKLTLADFCRALGISHNIIYHRFGSWRNMREAAGLPRHRPSCPAYSEADILADLLQVYQRAGRCPAHHDHKRWGGKISPTTIADRYGCWNGVRLRFELYLREIGLSHDPTEASQSSTENHSQSNARSSGRRSLHEIVVFSVTESAGGIGCGRLR